MSANTALFQQLRPCVNAYGHKFVSQFPPEGQFGYTTTVCEKCGMTPREARR